MKLRQNEAECGKKKINENIDKYRDNVIYCCKTLDNCRISTLLTT